MGACSNSVTILPEMNVATCLYTGSLAKHATGRNVLKILFNVLRKIYNTILITAYIKKHELWIHTFNID